MRCLVSRGVERFVCRGFLDWPEFGIDLGLAEGAAALAIVKSTDVIVGVE